jgi:hypothetical protein
METWRKWFRKIHIHVAFVITGMVIIYSISGILMNHMDTWGYDVSYLPVLNEMTEMHYSPNSVWAWFSDIFAIGLFSVAFTGLFLIKGKKGIKGVGGIELLIGLAIPFILYFIMTKFFVQ